MMKDGVEGKLVPPGDPAALAGAIRNWFLHAEKAEAFVESARNTAISRHNPQNNAIATLRVYNDIIEQNRKSLNSRCNLDGYIRKDIDTKGALAK